MKQEVLEKRIRENLEIQAKKMALLLYDSTMPDDIKEAWIALLPWMSLGQMDKLLNILEAKYLDGQTKDIDEKYKDKLKEVAEKFEKEQYENDKKLLEQINKLKKIL